VKKQIEEELEEFEGKWSGEGREEGGGRNGQDRKGGEGGSNVKMEQVGARGDGGRSSSRWRKIISMKCKGHSNHGRIYWAEATMPVEILAGTHRYPSKLIPVSNH